MQNEPILYYTCLSIYLIYMGRGDKKSAKGKRAKGSFGVSRSKNAIKSRMKRVSARKSSTTPAEEAQAKPKRTVKKKADA